MIQRVLAKMKRGTTSVRELSRRLGMEEGAVRQLLLFMVRKRMIRELHSECQPKGCRGCPAHGMCDSLPVTGYELTGESQ